MKDILKKIDEVLKEDAVYEVQAIVSAVRNKVHNMKGFTFEELAILLMKIKKAGISTEGWEVVKKFILGMSPGGFNRPQILKVVLRGLLGEPIFKYELRSYQNTDLYKLFETGDIEKRSWHQKQE